MQREGEGGCALPPSSFTFSRTRGRGRPIAVREARRLGRPAIVFWPLVVGLAFACHDVRRAENDAPPSAEGSTSETDVASTPSDSLHLWLELPNRVRAGEPVPIALRVKNVTDRPLELHLTGRTIAFDLIVALEDGTVVWRRLEGEVIPAILRLETLGPGETLTLEETWDQRSNAGETVGPGTYTVRGELLTEGEPLVAPSVSLRIEPG